VKRHRCFYFRTDAFSAHQLSISMDANGPTDRKIRRDANGPIDRNSHSRSSSRIRNRL
jgi:hypothetical protein